VDEKVEQKPISIAVLSLHTHWITADAVKERVHLDVKGAGGLMVRSLPTSPPLMLLLGLLKPVAPPLHWPLLMLSTLLATLA
jgi:hypothetical protein